MIMHFLIGYALVMVGLCGSALGIIGWSQAAKRRGRNDRQKSMNQHTLMDDVDSALKRKDVNELRRIRLVHFNELKRIDEGLPERLDAYADDLYIQQDDEQKFTRSDK